MCAIAAMAVLSIATGTGAAERRILFSRDVNPILSNNCFACHGPDAVSAKGGLRLDQPESATSKLKSGRRAIVPGKPEESELVRRIGLDDPKKQMPPADSHKSLTAAQKTTLRQWIEQGGAYAQHWSFVAPVRPPIPEVHRAGWALNSIDRFILARLEAEGLSPSPEADRYTLVRRLYLDLTGLPPTPAQADAFARDNSPGAYETLVDRLLASPHFGERLAMPWLDAARYADTNGFSIDDHRDMWAWRDWVIDAFNTNMPYDRFITEQLAGDLLPGATDRQKVATGFLRNSMSTHEGGTLPEEYQVIYIADKINTVATTFMGLTLRCAQCHDHKYDPLKQNDYYAMFAFFNNAIEPGHGTNNSNTKPIVEVEPLLGDVATMRARLTRRIEALNHRKLEAQKITEPKQRDIAIKTLDVEIGVIKPIIERGKVSTMVMQEQAKPPQTYVLTRGQYDHPDHNRPVSPATPAVLAPMPASAPRNRLGLAQWLVQPSNPLTARVAVNRYWQMLMGTGIVSTADDFGSQGDYPSHPELLDFLARDFADNGWDTKRMIKQIVMSATYRQSSNSSSQLREIDPDNRLLAHSSRRRLSAESVRDNALAVCGALMPDIGGPSVFAQQPLTLWREMSHYGYESPFTAQDFVASEGQDLFRRSMYTFWKRTCPPPAMSVFDAPTRETCAVVRSRTNTPLQALVLLNDPQFVEAARLLAEQAIHSEKTTEGRLRFAFRRAVIREPQLKELAILTRRLDAAIVHFKADPAAAQQLLAVGATPRDTAIDSSELAAFASVTSVILNLDETITRE